MRRRTLLGLAGLLPLVPRPASSAAAFPVVATFSILADLVRQVGGDRVDVASLIGPDSEAHAFEPAPGDAARLARARLVVTNGLGFEGWIDRLVRASGTKAAIVVASAGIAPMRSEGDEARGPDPHAFQDVAHVKRYVDNIRTGLVAADPDGREVYERHAAAYGAVLARLDEEVRAELGRIPTEGRRAITNHDAFGYFAAAYGIRFIALRGIASDADISARDVARIVRQIRAERIPAVFLENVSDPRMMEQIAQESGARIGGKLYSDALSAPSGPAATYADLMRQNAKTIAAALVPR